MSEVRLQNFLLFLVLVIGIGLRFNQLGHDSLWNDEAGQALVAMQPSFHGMLEIIRSHAMAMPLDYFVTWLISHFALDEAVLRFPACAFGVFTLLIYYVFLKKTINFEVALLTTWLLSIFPLHIMYSQEMRFYEALSFFYILSNVYLFRAIKRSTKENWLIFILVTALGGYFHLYILFVPINGFIYLLLTRGLSSKNAIEYLKLFVTTFVLLLIITPGYAYFNATDQFSFELTPKTNPLIIMLLRGIGWIPYPFHHRTPFIAAFELSCLVVAIIGLIVVIRYSEKYKIVFSLIIGAVLQILIIVLGDRIKDYFFAARQIIHLAPSFLILTSLGYSYLIDRWMVQRIGESFHGIKTRMICLCGIMVMIGLFAYPRIVDYYRFPKSNGGQITKELLSIHHNLSSIIYVIPGYEEKIYRFYLLRDGGSEAERIIPLLIPANLDEIAKLIQRDEGTQYIIMPGIREKEQYYLDYLVKQGFKVLVSPELNWHWARYLLVREK